MSKRNVMFVQVCGVVNAISHVVLVPTKTFFIRIVGSKPLNIVVKNTEHFDWLKFLRVGQAYNFTRCIPKVLNKGTDEELQFVEASAFSKIQEVVMALPLPLMMATLEAVSYSGNIMDDSLSHLGLYELEDKSVLCSSFLVYGANICSLKSMDAITVYNAHSKMNEDVKYFILCTGSYLLRQASEEQRNSEPLHPIIDVVSAKNLNFEDFLWLKKTYSKLKILFDSGDFKVRKESDVLMNLVFDCKLNESLPVNKPRSYVKEFMCSPHRCAPLNTKKHPDLDIITTEDCFNYPCTKEINEKLWSYDLYPNFNFIHTKTNSVALVGKLEVNETNANLTLSSGFMPIQCVIPNITDFKTEVGSMVNSIVVVKKACLVAEKFRIFADESRQTFEEKNFVYILISPGQIYPISDKVEGKVHSVSETGNASKVLHSNNGDRRNGSNLDESQFLSQRFILHHISAPFFYFLERQFFCMVSLLGTPKDPRLMSDLLDEESLKNGRPCCLCMKGEMFRHYPFLCENRVYEVRYPVALKELLFDKRVNLPALQSAAGYLPCKSGVIIPDGSVLLGPFVSPHLPGDSTVNKDIYGIKESLSSVEDGEIVHLQGIVVARTHQTPKFKQKYKENIFGFGVPKGKNIALELKDWVTDETMKVYITSWYLKQYPLGLLIGSSVCITFVQKKFSGKNNHFYQSTCFTRIQILDNPDKCDPSDLFLDDKKRHSFIAEEVGVRYTLYSPFWGVFSISKVWNVEITSVCKTCDSVIRYGRCSYVGCLNLLKESTISARANFSVDDGSGHAYMHAKNDHVRKLLGLSEIEWKTLGEMAAAKEVMYAYKKEDQCQDGRRKRVTLDLDQVIFKGFCEEAVTTKPWHILCRKFFVARREETMRLMCLDVNDLDVSRIESLCS